MAASYRWRFHHASLLLLASSLAAQGSWLPCDALTPISPRTGHALVPLPNGDLLLFGGDAATPSATEWVWDGVRWLPFTTSVPRRDGAALASFGPGRVLVFGGADTSGSLTDTWRSDDGSTWTNVPSALAPGVLTDMSMVGVPGEDRAVLLGRSGGSTWETWFYDVANGWTAGPQLVAPSAVLVADAVRREVQVFLGTGPGLAVQCLEGNQWLPLVSLPAAPAVDEIAFDARRGRSVLLQPFANRATDEFDGLALVVSQLGSGAPVTADRTAMAFDARRDEVLLVTNYAGVMETWRLTVLPAPTVYSFGEVCGGPIGHLSVQPGDLPRPGATHRLVLDGVNTGFPNVLLAGNSTSQYSGGALPVTIPVGAGTCDVLVEPVVYFVMGSSVPATVWLTVPPSPTLIGARYAAQVIQVNVFDVVAVSDALQVQVGLPLPEFELRETFSNELNRDALVSGDRWLGGAVVQAQIGGDGRHGSFDPTFGALVAPGVYEWQTDNLTIPASASLDGQALVVTDGRFYFTDLVVPAGVTVRFRGPVPAKLFVRGRVDVQGTIDVSGVDMPSVIGILPAHVGQRISSFNSRGIASSLVVGQNGGAGGAGGGRGGNGGNECPGNVAATAASNGQPGEDVRLPAGHAYAGTNAGTGGAGSPVHPANGLSSSASTNLIGNIYRSFFSPGGGGGGYSVAGNLPAVPSIPGQPVQPTAGPTGPASQTFNPLPFPASPPPGYSSLDHFLIGGSGGGGGGAHPFGTFAAITTAGQTFQAGHGGSGGGGAIVLRAGGDLVVSANGSIVARGGDGVLITSNNPANDTLTPVPAGYDNEFGASSPGGGGSGGTVLLQSGRSISVPGAINTRGGQGSRNGGGTPVALNLNVLSQAGNGSPGYYRLEAGTTAQFSGTGVPAFQPTQNTGPLLDVDGRTGSRSTWLLPATGALPVYVRYELLALVQGQPLLFSDDPTVSTLAANDPSGPVQLRLQAGFFDAMTGQVGEATWGPWRSTAAVGPDSINRDHGNAVRFDLTVDRTLFVVNVLDLRIVWR
ncbi:MAG: hypothetical protein U1F60_03130 [Planctomycetota bacterium]